MSIIDKFDKLTETKGLLSVHPSIDSVKHKISESGVRNFLYDGDSDTYYHVYDDGGLHGYLASAITGWGVDDAIEEMLISTPSAYLSSVGGVLLVNESAPDEIFMYARQRRLEVEYV